MLRAAQYRYLDGLQYDEILDSFHCIGTDELTETTLQGWLTDPGVLRYLAFDRLCYTTRELVSCILQIPNLSHEKLLSLWNEAQERSPNDEFGQMSWALVTVGLLRYFINRTAEEIAGGKVDFLQTWERNQEYFEELLVSLRDRLPFCHEMQRIVEALRDKVDIKVVFGAPGLWERLGFQYAYLFELRYKDILERTSPPAAIVG
jgi:hypothetical protein